MSAAAAASATAMGRGPFLALTGLLAALALASFAALWGMDGETFPWAFAVVMWMFVTGLSQAGICFTAVMRLLFPLGAAAGLRRRAGRNRQCAVPRRVAAAGRLAARG